MRLRAEFTTEPFEGEGEPPGHATVARDCVLQAGLQPEFGPLGTALVGDRAAVLEALASVLDKVWDEGANRITLQVSTDDETTD